MSQRASSGAQRTSPDASPTTQPRGASCALRDGLPRHHHPLQRRLPVLLVSRRPRLLPALPAPSWPRWRVRVRVRVRAPGPQRRQPEAVDERRHDPDHDHEGAPAGPHHPAPSAHPAGRSGRPRMVGRPRLVGWPRQLAARSTHGTGLAGRPGLPHHAGPTTTRGPTRGPTTTDPTPPAAAIGSGQDRGVGGPQGSGSGSGHQGHDDDPSESAGTRARRTPKLAPLRRLPAKHSRFRPRASRAHPYCRRDTREGPTPLPACPGTRHLPRSLALSTHERHGHEVGSVPPSPTSAPRTPDPGPDSRPASGPEHPSKPHARRNAISARR